MSHIRRYLVAEQRLVDMFVHEDDPAVADWNAARASLRRLASASESQMARQAAAYEAEIAARALAELDPLLEITREPDGSWGVGLRAMRGHVGGGLDLPAAAVAAADAAEAWIEARDELAAHLPEGELGEGHRAWHAVSARASRREGHPAAEDSDLEGRRIEALPSVSAADSPYARVNLFLSPYRPDPAGQVRLPDGAHLACYRGRVTPEGWVSDPHGEAWIMLEDGNFWAVMIRYDPARDRISPP